MVGISNYFFDTRRAVARLTAVPVRNVYIKEAFDTGVRYDFKGNFDLEGFERGIEGLGRITCRIYVATITSNSAGGQPVSLANLKAMYSIAKEMRYSGGNGLRTLCKTPISSSSVKRMQRLGPSADHRKTYKYADMLAMSARSTMVPMGGLLYMKNDSFFDVYTECRTLCVVQERLPTYGGLEGGAMERTGGGSADGMNLDWLAYRIAQVQYLVDGLEEIGVVCRRAVTRHSLMPVNCCRISRQTSSGTGAGVRAV
ncbi:beta-eliminating lyase-related protein [Enterobacter hormaechei]